jgi:nucleotide-binding universal stress UspA family protein
MVRFSIDLKHLQFSVKDSIPSKKTNANIVVIGTRGLGKMQFMFLCSVSDKVIKNCHYSVLTVRK